MEYKNKKISLKAILNNIKEDRVSEFSAQCAYYIILSFIPFIILLLTLIQYTNIQQEQLFYIISKIVPINMSEIVLGIIREVYSKSLGTISISLIFTLFSAHKGLYAFMKGLNFVYKGKSDNTKPMIYLRLLSIIQTIIFIILVAIGLVILVFGTSIIATIQDKFGLLKNYTIISKALTEAVYIFIVFIIFLFLYKFMSGHKLTFKSQIPGAFFSAISLIIISFVFSNYLNIFKGFSITYGSLTALMLIMMWTYACFYVIFLGAEINKWCNLKE